MRLTGGQNIPSILHKKYTAVAGVERNIRGNWYINARPAFRNLPQQGGKIKGLGITDYNSGVTFAQKVVRSYFRDATKCFKLQPPGDSGTWGVPGPIGREKWFWAGFAAGMWYYDYFMKESLLLYNAGSIPMWCPSAELVLWITNSERPDEQWNNTPDTDVGEYYDSQWNRLWIKKPEGYTKFNLFLMGTFDDFGPPDVLLLKVYKSMETWAGGQPTWNTGPFDVTLIEAREYTCLAEINQVWAQFNIPDCYSIMLDVEWQGEGAWFLPKIVVAADAAWPEDKIPYWSN